MATDFQLPDTLPPGNTFPARPASSKAAVPKANIELQSLKIDTRQVVIAVTEAQAIPEIFPPPPARVVDSRPSTPTRNVLSSQARENDGSTSPSAARSRAASPMPAQNGNNALDQQSPVMRSMFPRFDPSLPLASQQYLPVTDRAPPTTLRQPDAVQYSPSLYSQPRSPPTAVLNDPWAASRIQSTLISSSPLRVSEEPPPTLSSGEELLDLWTIANGQDSPEAAGSYSLGLRWLVI